MVRSNTVERTFAVATLLLISGAFIPHIRGGADQTLGGSSGDPVLQLVWGLIYLVTVAIVAIRWRQIKAIAFQSKLLLALIGFTMLSVTWSADPGLTARRGIALVCTTLFGMYLAGRFNLSDILRLAATAITIAAIASILSVVLLPEVGIMSGEHAGSWQGVFQHKNLLGRLMALNIVMLLLLRTGGGIRRISFTVAILLCLGLLLMSNSKGALLVFAVTMLALVLFRMSRWHYALMVSFGILALLVLGGAASWLYANRSALLSLVGKSDTLSGRTLIWELVANTIARKPVLGYGYSAFWTQASGEASLIRSLLRWETPHSHNGFLDLWLELGGVGVALFAAGFAIFAYHAFRWARGGGSKTAYWPLLYLTYMLVFNQVESAILKPNNVFWTLYVAVGLSVVAGSRRLDRHENKHSYTGGDERGTVCAAANPHPVNC